MLTHDDTKRIVAPSDFLQARKGDVFSGRIQPATCSAIVSYHRGTGTDLLRSTKSDMVIALTIFASKEQSADVARNFMNIVPWPLPQLHQPVAAFRPPVDMLISTCLPLSQS